MGVIRTSPVVLFPKIRTGVLYIDASGSAYIYAGDGTSDPSLRYNIDTDKWQFSNNGTIWMDIWTSGSFDTTLDDVCENGNITDVVIIAQGSGSVFNSLLINNNFQVGNDIFVGNNVNASGYYIINSGADSLIFFDSQDGDFVGGDYGFIGQKASGKMMYDIEPSSPEPYHSFTVQENEVVRIDSNSLDVTGTIKTTSSGSTFNTLTTVNDLQVGGNLHVASGSTLFIPGSWDDRYPGIQFAPELGGHNFYWNTLNHRFVLDNKALINGDLAVAGTNVYISSDNSSVDTDAALYFCGGPSETLHWDYANSRFELSNNLWVDGVLITTTSGSIFNTLTTVNNFQVGNDIFVGNNVNASGYYTSNSGSDSLIFFDSQNRDFQGGDYGFIGQKASGKMMYNIEPSSPEPYHSFTVQENEVVRIDSNSLDVTGIITTSSSGSVFNSLTTVNDLQVGGDLFVEDTIKFKGGKTLLYNSGNNRFEFNADIVVSGDVATTNVIYINADASSVEQDATLYFGGGPSETLKWDHTNGRFEFSDDLHVNGIITNNVSGSIFNTLTTVGNTHVSSLIAGDGVNCLEVKDDGEINLHGTARVVNHVRVAAPSWGLGVVAPSKGFVGIVPVLEFDKTADDSVHYSLIVPYRMVSGSTITAIVDWCYTGAQDAGTVCWSLEYLTIASGSVVDGSTTTITKTDGGVPTGEMMRTILNTGITGAVAHEILGLRLYRDVSEDNLNTDAKMMQTHFMFLNDKLGKAT